MKKFLALALFASLPGLAQAETSWTGRSLTVRGDDIVGCDLRVVQVTHDGGRLSRLQFVILNRATTAVRVTGTVILHAQGERIQGTISGVIAGNQQGTLMGFRPPGGSLFGSIVDINFFYGCSAT